MSSILFLLLLLMCHSLLEFSFLSGTARFSDSIDQSLHILLCLLCGKLFSLVLTINLSLNFELLSRLSFLQSHLIAQFQRLQFSHCFLRNSHRLSDFSFFIGTCQFQILTDSIMLMLNQQLFDSCLYRAAQHFAIMDIHTIFGEEQTLMGTFTFMSINSNIANNVTIISPELFNGVFLCSTLDASALTVTHELNIILNREPFALIFGIKINAVGNLYSSLNEILSFNINNVAYFVVFMAQENGLNQIIGSLRTSSRQFQNFQSLVVVQQNSLRTTDNLTSAILRNYINCITSPNVDGNNALKLVIQSNRAGLSVRSATRNISLSL